MRQAGLGAEADEIQSHLDEVGSEERLLEVMMRATAAQEATKGILESWRPIIEAATLAVQRLSKAEEKRATLEERAINDASEARGLRYQHIIAPIVTTIAGILAGWGAATWGG